MKFIGGMGTLGAGMVLGREGSTVQLGGNLGRMVLDVCRLRGAEARHTLLATGAASGLTAAFNAPLAGILFIIEEMRPQFRYDLISIKAVFIGVIMASIVFRLFNGKLAFAPINTLWLYLLLGAIFGAVGVLFNTLIFHVQDIFYASRPRPGTTRSACCYSSFFCAHAYHDAVLLFGGARKHFRADAGIRHAAWYCFQRGRHVLLSARQ